MPESAYVKIRCINTVGNAHPTLLCSTSPKFILLTNAQSFMALAPGDRYKIAASFVHNADKDYPFCAHYQLLDASKEV